MGQKKFARLFSEMGEFRARGVQVQREKAIHRIRVHM